MEPSLQHLRCIPVNSMISVHGGDALRPPRRPKIKAEEVGVVKKNESFQVGTDKP